MDGSRVGSIARWDSELSQNKKGLAGVGRLFGRAAFPEGWPLDIRLPWGSLLKITLPGSTLDIMNGNMGPGAL